LSGSVKEGKHTMQQFTAHGIFHYHDHQYHSVPYQKDHMKKITFLLLFMFCMCPLVGASFDKAALKKLYRHVSGFNIDTQEYESLKQKKGDPLYGEITFEGVQKMVDELKLTQNDVFCDLGCGVGKTCVQVLLTTPVKKCIGVELSPTRIAHAQTVREKLKESKKINRKKQLIFLHDDIGRVDVREGTVFYICCYDAHVVQSAVANITRIPHPFRMLSLICVDHPALTLIKKMEVPMSWSSQIPLYVYGKK
jgi:SAM-dependent methyltransferase